MKTWRIAVICMMVFLVSISCKAVTGNIQSEVNNTIPESSEDISATSVTSDIPLPVPNPGGLITKVTLAHDSTPEDFDPIDPTTKFKQGDTIHAIVAVKKAPAGTLFSVKWLTIDVGDNEKADYLIDTTETEQGGSGNLDFTLSPDSKFMPGTYRVEVYVNGELDQLKIYSIIAGN
jgi:hypothetical protein